MPKDGNQFKEVERKSGVNMLSGGWKVIAQWAEFPFMMMEEIWGAGGGDVVPNHGYS